MKIRIGRFTLRKETPKILFDKHIRKIWDKRLRENSIWNKRFLVLTNNYCDQKCYSCSAKCDTDYGDNPFRWEKHTTPLSSVEKFLDLIDGYRPKYWIRLSGGETTLCGPEYLKELCEIVHQHERNISLLTNGARMLECDPDWFEFIHLDEHIVNSDLIKKIRKDFKKKKFNRYQVWKTKEHRDLDLQRKGHITEGLDCSDHMDAISLWRDTVFPCCVSPFLDGWNGNTKVREAQIKAGWTISNPDLVKLLENQECGVNSLLEDSINACKTECWKGGKNIEFKPVS